MKIVLAKNAGFCFGVKAAVLRISSILNRQSPLYINGQIIHNPDIVRILETRGLKKTDISRIPPGSSVVIRTHGTEYQTLKDIIRSSSRTINLTCPRVGKIQGIIRKFIKKGYYIIIAGDPEHPEVQSLSSYANGNFTVISKPEELAAISPDKKFLLISQTTFDQCSFSKISEAALKKYPDIEIINTICDSTQNRQTEIEKAREQGFDTVVVIGGKNSANTRSLAHIAEKNNLITMLTENGNELTPDSFSHSRNILVNAGASTPVWLIDYVLNRLLLIKLRYSFLPGFIRHFYRLFSDIKSLPAASGIFALSLSLLISREYKSISPFSLIIPPAAAVIFSFILIFPVNRFSFLRKYAHLLLIPALFTAVFLTSSFIDDIIFRAGYSLTIAYCLIAFQFTENIFDYEKNIIFGLRTPVSVFGLKGMTLIFMLISGTAIVSAAYGLRSPETTLGIILTAAVSLISKFKRPLFTSSVRFLFVLLSAVLLAITLVHILT